MTTRLPFTEESLALAIRAADAAGEKVIGIKADGTLVFESGSNGATISTVINEYIYFLGDGDYIKIGYSLNWRARHGQIQAFNPRDLTVYAVFLGTQAEEWALHQKFAAHRVRNEWFRDCEEIRSYIAARKHECKMGDAK